MQYFLAGYEPGIYVEIYLPKKTIYQPFLFEILTKGFDINYVRAHFLSPEKRDGILQLIGRNPSWATYNDAYVAQLTPFFHGYSMYEVDGVFNGPKTTVVEERTQILRLIFRLNHRELAANAGLPEEDVTEIRALICDYLRAHHRERCVEKATGRDRQVYEAVRRWRDHLGFFIFGYIIFELCAHIEQLFSDGQISKTEDEIWVANFSNIELDRVTWSMGSMSTI